MQNIALMSAIQDSNFIIGDSCQHYAVAIRFDPTRDETPMIVAQGKNSGAAYIQKIAKSSGISSIENPSLAEALYAYRFLIYLFPILASSPNSLQREVPKKYHKDVVAILEYHSSLPKEQK